MKKIRALLCGLVILPMLVLCACGSTKTFSVKTWSSNGNLGMVSGGSTSKFSEGTEISLVATPKNSVNFLCWVKDYTKVTSTEATTKIKVNANTAGDYTGVFEETEAKDMVYVGLSEVSVDTSDFTSIKYTVSYSPADNTELSIVLEEGTSETGIFNPFTGSLFRIMENNKYVSYIFKIELTITSRDGNYVTYPYTNRTSDLLLSQNKFSGSETATLIKTESGRPTLNLTFSKLNTALLESMK